MSVPLNGADDPQPPPWFAHEEEPQANGSGPRRILIGAGVFVVVLIMILIPLLQAGILRRQRAALPDEATERTAFLFASAMLFGRSEGQALIFTDADARDEVRATLQRILDRPSPSNGARLQVISAPCGDRGADSCFQGRLLDPAAFVPIAIRFGIDRTAEDPKVVWVEIDERRAHAPGARPADFGTASAQARGLRVVPFDRDKPGTFGHPQAVSSVAR